MSLYVGRQSFGASFGAAFNSSGLKGAALTGASGNRLLLSDGTSFALQTNGTSKIQFSASFFALLGGGSLLLLDGISHLNLIG